MAFGTFGTSLIGVFGEIARPLNSSLEKLIDRLNVPVPGTAADGLKLAVALLWEHRGERPGAVPVLVCHD